ncbi:hypothetical protein HMI55_004854 [Coelomomyces lativittatus]|nr:hypothetical protein HMI55_004854 [Coelomomyces lativittatus]
MSETVPTSDLYVPKGSLIDKNLLDATKDDDSGDLSFKSKLKYTWAVIKNLQVSDMNVLTQTTCARNAMMNGITGGLGIGLLRFAMLGKPQTVF